MKPTICGADLKFKTNRKAFRAAYRKEAEKMCVANGVPKKYWRHISRWFYEFITGK